ncbi:energy-coupling factor transporter transmembrane protein EcfT [Gordonia sp. ABSL1-1]|uniref:energy-coupling factor transporter transmembrane component T family protein n=1 Tax=Gordonia sp. ABSL1-1 TaxID=3053923 RepID=UPI0025743E11|nr:energy-coupling factor transporter transmembrane protein EcfT [Gordonia sp. ABSL1-1]MDL9938299.1 energy-coupling factor transporter transmembrane protein EcfT [Gordonia sp. ABSL1-1]
MSMLGTYVPGRSPIHRLPAGFKLLALFGSIIAMTLSVHTLLGVAISCACVVATFALAGVGPRQAWPLMRGAVWVVGIVLVMQLIITDWQRAVVVCTVLIAAIALAAVVTLTTRTADMLDAMMKALAPLARFGVRTDLIAMALALTIRSIPLIAEIAVQVDQARRARGLRAGPRVLVVPVVLAALATADGFADTLAARGLD